ncbi:hypothetical protein EK21DRAFT_61538 [Setomelanomma holmii]|uniref:Uncharacterized protein n=1 Tax=Setomelanomma holmii TaxID=210430 RepID=A0A9P4LPW2_9PLEO|nr:hypothetical protein EK21DRAFT_61538 [Setomelanomma holmii]
MTPIESGLPSELQPRVEIAKISHQQISGGANPRQRFSKSRNGMCPLDCFLQTRLHICARRRIACGGYKVDVRWKQAVEPRKQTSPKSNRTRSIPHGPRPNATDRGLPMSRQDPRVNSRSDPDIERPQQQLPVNTSSEEIMHLGSPDTGITLSAFDISTPGSLGLLVSSFEHNESRTGNPPRLATYGSSSPPLGHGNDETNNLDFSSELWMGSFSNDCLRSPGSSAGGSGLVLHNAQDHESEKIAVQFREKIGPLLSIGGDTDRNKWWALIWPLAERHPPLFGAVAAMTRFGMIREPVESQIDGTERTGRSAQLLSEQLDRGEIPLDVALAATLALALAETWDHENFSGGVAHIRRSGLLLQQITSNQDTVGHTRLVFLANTWTYMDTLARFTSPNLSQPYPGPRSSPDLSFFANDPAKLDPLMGYATTLFPVIRDVADPVNKVRAREALRNSSAIISQALELRRAIEQRTLPIDLETIDDPSQLMTDAVQTAEAYRWSTLLMLYQTVPEFPNLTSYGELAQRILVYLATIPLSSTTIIVHTFPLMVAGCDTVEEEDRQFIRDKWNEMAQRMVPGVIERCLKITEEIWKRREKYLRTRGLAFTANGRQVNTAMNDSTALSKDIASFINFGTSPGAITATSSGSVERPVRKANDFPISAAFKKGVDMLTRSGCTEYTVRGRLHWLGVMNDRNWQCKSSLSHQCIASANHMLAVMLG